MTFGDMRKHFGVLEKRCVVRLGMTRIRRAKLRIESLVNRMIGFVAEVPLASKLVVVPQLFQSFCVGRVL